MLDALRNKTGSWVVKIFIGVLAASFAVWGVADVFTTRPTDTLAEVGTRQISVQEYSNRFQRQLRQLSQQLGQPLTAAQGRQFGLDRQVLGSLLRDAALEAQADQMKLMVSDTTVAQRIADNPQFQNSQGVFNKDQFLALLRNNGLNEQMFVIAEKQGLIRGAIATTIEQGAATPKQFAKFAHKFRNEQRDAAYIAVTVPEMTIAEPSDGDLKTFYEANPQLFAIPERRVIAAIQVTPDTLTDRIQISDADVAKRYEDRKADYSTPEKRTIQQITFASVADAAAAKAKIDGGTSFQDIAKQKNLSETDINLGTFTRDALPDQKLAEAAFGLAKDAVSAPVEGKLATVLLRVTNIEAGSQKSLGEVAGEIKKALQIDGARDEILSIYDKIEEFR
ncbi:MAG: SurA N-terminal domain-containing protein, partial [Hyphomicrobiales bacterium]|nr:SurA N-terminal domain-containing protein [Hyphomicrobiales bacterium]